MLKIPQPPAFNFRNTVYSHGWSELPPFELDEEKWRLSYVFDDPAFARPVPAVISAPDGRIAVAFPEEDPDAAGRKLIVEKVRRILRLEEDLGQFYQLTRRHGDFRWIEEKGAGRLLRSPTVFEDLVKTICTTNCSWGLTRKMVSNLVERLGAETSGGKKAFPTPEAMAGRDEDFYRVEIRAGYRAPYLRELAAAVAEGRLDPERWLAPDLPTADLKRELKAVKGVGDYAAENMLKLLGRYDGLALDSFLRSEFYKKRNREAVCPDAEIRAYYEDFGEWRGLAIWLDMTRRWFE